MTRLPYTPKREAFFLDAGIWLCNFVTVLSYLAMFWAGNVMFG